MINLTELANQGVAFEVINGRLAIGSDKEILQEMRSFITQNKQEIMVTVRLNKIAQDDHQDLLDWYEHDFSVIESLDDVQLAYLVMDYLDNRNRYRNYETGDAEAQSLERRG